METHPLTISEIQECIRREARLRASGAGSKSALRPEGGVHVIDMRRLEGIIEYQPEEFTIIAWAGSRMDAVQRCLAEHGQYLPFDPVLVERGSTLGGTVASGLSGPGRYRYGGLRDFLLGVKFLDGQGNLISSGGKVVKNAAGFDLAKLMVGSLGEYGVLVELAFKVFPRPTAHATLLAAYGDLQSALTAMNRLASAALELFALDLEVNETNHTLLARLGGSAELLPARMERLRARLRDDDPTLRECRVVEWSEEQEIWREAGEFLWVGEGYSLVKIPLTPQRVMSLDQRLGERGAKCRYSVGGNLAWVAWPGPASELDAILGELGLSGLVVLGAPGQPLIGRQTGAAFASRVKRALDPMGKF